MKRSRCRRNNSLRGTPAEHNADYTNARHELLSSIEEASQSMHHGDCQAAGAHIDEGYINVGRMQANAYEAGELAEAARLHRELRDVDAPFEQKCVRSSPLERGGSAPTQRVALADAFTQPYAFRLQNAQGQGPYQLDPLQDADDATWADWVKHTSTLPDPHDVFSPEEWHRKDSSWRFAFPSHEVAQQVLTPKLQRALKQKGFELQRVPVGRGARIAKDGSQVIFRADNALKGEAPLAELRDVDSPFERKCVRSSPLERDGATQRVALAGADDDVAYFLKPEKVFIP